MARSRVGLDVGSTAVRAAEVTMGEPMTVVRAAQVPLQRGAVELGEVRQPEVVGQAIRELWQRGGFKARQVVMGVGNQRCVVREVAIPWLPEKELRASLGFQVQEYIPMSVDEAVLDYDLLGEFEQEGRKMLRLLLVAAQRAMVNNLVAAAQAGKVEPVGVDLIPFAIVRSVGADGLGMDLEGGEEAVIDVGAHVTNICVHDQQATRFVRILPSGGRDITLAIARSLGLEEDVAERLKRGEPVEGAPSVEEARRVAMARAGSFVDEIRSSLEFYTAQVQGARIGRVLVTGGGSKLEGFLELLRERIPVPVDRGRPFAKVRSRLNLSEEAAAEAEPVLAAAIGLAIPGRSS
ncbi:MAG TPA: type IV pilus assembly protein PilM [Actinomycetota bacterium]|nr:type IV pilus assembly protein PilM [Actinomycetota bacterium]